MKDNSKWFKRSQMHVNITLHVLLWKITINRDRRRTENTHLSGSGLQDDINDRKTTSFLTEIKWFDFFLTICLSYIYWSASLNIWEGSFDCFKPTNDAWNSNNSILAICRSICCLSSPWIHHCCHPVNHRATQRQTEFMFSSQSPTNMPCLFEWENTCISAEISPSTWGRISKEKIWTIFYFIT